MRHGGWPSASCAKEYIDDSLGYKIRTGKMIQQSIERTSVSFESVANVPLNAPNNVSMNTSTNAPIQSPYQSPIQSPINAPMNGPMDEPIQPSSNLPVDLPPT